MADVYTLNATAVPAAPSPAAITTLNAGSGSPLVARTFATGETAGTTAKLKENAARLDLSARFGGGAYAIAKGLTLSQPVAGSVTVAVGQAVCDGIVELQATYTLTGLTNSVRNYVWLQRTGVPILTTTTTPPATPCIFLGSVSCNGSGAFTDVDLSGVMYLRGGTPWRRTADTGKPGDTPPSTLQFMNHTATDLWWWDGLDYYRFAATSASPLVVGAGGTGGAGQLILNPATNYTLSATDITYRSYEVRSGGSPGSPFAITWPSLAAADYGREWTVDNTSGQSLTLVGPDSSQVYLINNTRCGVKWDGTTFVRTWYSTPQYFAAVVSGGTYTFGGWSEVDADHMLLTPSGGNTTVVFPSGAALHKRGRRIAIQNDHTTLWILVKTGGAPVSQQWVLLPGEIGDFIIDGSGGINRCDTRNSAKLAAISYPSDADYTVVHPDFLADIIEVSQGSLASNKNLILPTITDKSWVINNKTTNTITVKTSGGTGVAIATTKVATVYGDGTNIVRATPDA